MAIVAWHGTLHRNRACECAHAAASRAVCRGRRDEQLAAPVVASAIRLGIAICLGIEALPNQMATAVGHGALHGACERACAGRATGVAVVAADQRCVPVVAILLGIGIWLGIGSSPGRRERARKAFGDCSEVGSSAEGVEAQDTPSSSSAMKFEPPAAAAAEVCMPLAHRHLFAGCHVEVRFATSSDPAKSHFFHSTIYCIPRPEYLRTPSEV